MVLMGRTGRRARCMSCKAMRTALTFGKASSDESCRICSVVCFFIYKARVLMTLTSRIGFFPARFHSPFSVTPCHADQMRPRVRRYTQTHRRAQPPDSSPTTVLTSSLSSSNTFQAYLCKFGFQPFLASSSTSSCASIGPKSLSSRSLALTILLWR